MSNIHKKGRTRRTCAAAVLAFAAIMTGANMSAEAREITGVQHRVSQEGERFLDVTFEAGEPDDSHALYIAYDTEDKGADISNWAALQRGCNVAADATAATIPADCVRPKGGEYILTTCGGFDAEGVTVSLAAGTPKWVKGVSVNTDGNIVIDVKPMGTMIIVR